MLFDNLKLNIPFPTISRMGKYDLTAFKVIPQYFC